MGSYDFLKKEIRLSEKIGRHVAEIRGHNQRPSDIELWPILVERQESLQRSNVLEGTRPMPRRTRDGGVPPRRRYVYEPIYRGFVERDNLAVRDRNLKPDNHLSRFESVGKR